MNLIILVIVVLIISGLAFLFDLKPGKVMEDASALVEQIRTYYFNKKYSKRIPIKKQVEYITAGKKENFIAKNFNDAKNILFRNRKNENLHRVYIGSAAGVILACVISALLKNVFILPPLAVGFALVPAWAVKLMEAHIVRNTNDELETALSCITASYMRTDNIVLAVEENLDLINPPMNQLFLTFCNENKMINSNVIYGINKLKGAFNNTIFAEWCDAMIQCQSDRTLKATLYPIVQKFTEIKRVQAELDTAMMMPLQEFILMTVVLLLLIPIMAAMQPEWYDILTNTLMGKLLLSATVVIVIIGINKAINLSAPIEYKK